MGMAAAATAAVGSYGIVVGGESAGRRPSGSGVQGAADVVVVGAWFSAILVAVAVGVWFFITVFVVVSV